MIILPNISKPEASIVVFAISYHWTRPHLKSVKQFNVEKVKDASKHCSEYFYVTTHSLYNKTRICFYLTKPWKYKKLWLNSITWCHLNKKIKRHFDLNIHRRNQCLPEKVTKWVCSASEIVSLNSRAPWPDPTRCRPPRPPSCRCLGSVCVWTGRPGDDALACHRGDGGENVGHRSGLTAAAKDNRRRTYTMNWGPFFSPAGSCGSAERVWRREDAARFKNGKRSRRFVSDETLFTK